MSLVAAIAARTRCLSAVRTAVVICVVVTAAGATAPAASAAPAPSPAPSAAPPPSPPPAPDPAIRDADRLAARGKRPAAITALRTALARSDTADRRCALGLLHAAPAKPADLPRAHLYLLSCPSAANSDLAARGAAARASLDRTLRRSDLSPVEVDTGGAPLRLTIDTLRGDSVDAPARLWLPAGRHRLTGTAADGRTASAELAVIDGNRAMVTLVLPPPPRPPAAGTIDFADDEPAEVHRGAPPKVEHDSLLPAKYRKGVKARPRPRP